VWSSTAIEGLHEKALNAVRYICVAESQGYRSEMNTVLILVAVLGLFQSVIEVHSEGKPEPLFNDTIGWEYRLAENAIMLMKLDQHIVKLREKLDRKPVDIEAIYRRVENGVNRLEGE